MNDLVEQRASVLRVIYRCWVDGVPYGPGEAQRGPWRSPRLGPSWLQVLLRHLGITTGATLALGWSVRLRSVGGVIRSWGSSARGRLKACTRVGRWWENDASPPACHARSPVLYAPRRRCPRSVLRRIFSGSRPQPGETSGREQEAPVDPEGTGRCAADLGRHGRISRSLPGRRSGQLRGGRFPFVHEEDPRPQVMVIARGTGVATVGDERMGILGPGDHSGR